jgi:hypothetical protein
MVMPPPFMLAVEKRSALEFFAVLSRQSLKWRLKNKESESGISHLLLRNGR